MIHEISLSLASPQFLFEIIIVDDGSTDETLANLLKLSRANKYLRIIAHKKNYGQSVALLSGVRASAYNMVVTLDGDGQNDPADIARLFYLIEHERCVILGNRIKRHDSKLQKISSLVGNAVRNFYLKDGCPDTGCGLKIFSRSAFLGLPHFNHFHRFLPALFKRAGYELINAPVNHRPRVYGVSKYGVMNRLFVGIYDLIGLCWLLKRPCSPEFLDDID